MEVEARLIKELYEVGIRNHVYLEDSWYSCPKADNEPCSNPDEGSDCNCGADSNNEKLKAIYEELQGLIAEGI